MNAIASFFKKFLPAPASRAQLDACPKPERDWKIMLIVLSALIAVSAVLNAIMYSQIVRGELFLGRATVVQAGPALDAAALKALNASYAAKAQQFSSLSHAAAPFPDPSI